jgi:plasmid rolling circle replication initiator protein Rep
MPELKEKQGLDKSYLSTLSPKDAKFDTHKANTVKVSQLCGMDTEDGVTGFVSGKRAVSFSTYSAKIQQCGNWLRMVEAHNGYKLIDARFCKVPICPMCQFRRALKWKAKALELLPKVQEQYPSHRWLFLTLTIRNCELDDLKATIKRLNDAFNRLSKQSKFPFVGLVKSVEVTRAWDCYDKFTGKFIGRHGSKWIFDYEAKNNTALRCEPTSEVHPHLHVMGLVPSTYFNGKYYLKQAEWTEMWQKALRIDYVPIVDIRAIKCKKGQKIVPTPEEFEADKNTDSGMISAICETLKYTVKEQDLIGKYCTDDQVNSQWLKKVTEQLYRSRKVEYRGVIKEIGKELEAAYNDDDLIGINDNDDKPSEGQNLKEHTFAWYSSLMRYIKSGDPIAGDHNPDDEN